MRNASTPLTVTELATVAKVSGNLFRYSDGGTVSIDYVKRDGTASTLVGTIVDVVGAESTLAVRVLTDKGYRSANVWAITGIFPLV